VGFRSVGFGCKICQASPQIKLMTRANFLIAVMVWLAGPGASGAAAGFRSPESLIRNVYAYYGRGASEFSRGLPRDAETARQFFDPSLRASWTAPRDAPYDFLVQSPTWRLGAIPAGQKPMISVKGLAKGAGDPINQAVAQADGGLEAKASIAVHLEGVPALLLEVVDLEDPIEVGAETTYEIRVVNQGTSATTNLQIIATVPAGMTTRDATGPAPHRLQGQQVIFEKLPSLAAKADALYRVKVVGDKPGDMRFKVQMTSDQLRSPVYEEESTRVYKD